MSKFLFTRSFPLLLAGVSVCFPAFAAKMYEWRDDSGTRHMESTCPPECARTDHYEIEKGNKKLIKAGNTAEERASREQARLATQAAREKKLRDDALRGTYSSSSEIDIARKRNMQQMDARVNSMASQVKIVSDRLQGLQKEADGYKSQGKTLPPSLNDDLKDSQSRLEKLQADLDKAKADKAAMDARYDADKARYKELTGN